MADCTPIDHVSVSASLPYVPTVARASNCQRALPVGVCLLERAGDGGRRARAADLRGLGPVSHRVADRPGRAAVGVDQLDYMLEDPAQAGRRSCDRRCTARPEEEDQARVLLQARVDAHAGAGRGRAGRVLQQRRRVVRRGGPRLCDWVSLYLCTGSTSLACSLAPAVER